MTNYERKAGIQPAFFDLIDVLSYFFSKCSIKRKLSRTSRYNTLVCLDI
jgi:hypothetical protein